MSYPPPRPPMTIPGMPPMMPPPYMGGMIPMTMGMMASPMFQEMSSAGVLRLTSPQMMAPISHPASLHQHKPSGKKMIAPPMPPILLRPPEPDDMKGGPKGPPITVFVGNITERASDGLVRQILQHCGTVISWKRVQGANGKLQAFGFCEYADPESGLRAIRLLHEWDIGEKKLVVKVDAKTKEKLDEYKAVKKAAEMDGKKMEEKESMKKLEDELDHFTRKEDDRIRNCIKVSLREHSAELARIVPESRNSNEEKPKKLSKTQEALMKISLDIEKDPKNNLDEMDLEEEKKTLIHREIDKFRDTYKRAEEEKEREKRDKDRHRDRDRGDVREKERKEPRVRDHTPDRVRSRAYERAREKNLDERYSDRSRSPSREREWSRGSRDGSRERSREREWEKEREEEEEAFERKKLDRKLREKEAAYKERLRNWEGRERRRLKDYEKERIKEEERRLEELKEARRLKEFLEDYDDERDDPKYYKGSALARRMKEREKEMDADSRDRQREKEELDELRRKLAEEGHPDPIAEANRIHLEEEAKLVKAKVKMESEHKIRLPIKEEDREREEREDEEETPPPPPPVDEAEDAKDDSTENSLISGFSDVTTPREEFKPLGFAGLKLGASPLAAKSPPSQNTKKKRTTVEEVFKEDEETKKRKLVPLDDVPEDDKSSGGNQHLSTDEKRKHIKNLIDKIPTGKNELFEYSIDWSLVDGTLMERRIKPWINKKIVEYIGEEEPTLVEFICSKVLVGSAAQSILDDVSMVLDEEAEVFVVKMWRLLIYEIEAKKLGLVKPS